MQWEYVTTQGGNRFFRTSFKVNDWPVFAKELANGSYRAFEACHRPVRIGRNTIDGASAEELEAKLAMLRFAKA